MTHEELAEKCLVELVKHVLAYHDRTLIGITYEELARRIGFLDKNEDPHPRLGKVLGKMGHMLEKAQPVFLESIPHIQSLVVMKVGKNRGIPDDGIKEFWDGYERLSRLEKENKSFKEWRIIADFGSRWINVLKQLHLPIEPKLIVARPTDGQQGAGGESSAHKALKAFVKANPHLVGVAPGAEAFEEYALPSLDTVDVLFKTSDCWTAVEVKSSVSDGVPGDYKRGIYQVVKYSALLHAMRCEPTYLVPESIRVLLVLENSLPPSLVLLQKCLQVTVFENVNPNPMRQEP